MPMGAMQSSCCPPAALRLTVQAAHVSGVTCHPQRTVKATLKRVPFDSQSFKAGAQSVRSAHPRQIGPLRSQSRVKERLPEVKS